MLLGHWRGSDSLSLSPRPSELRKRRQTHLRMTQSIVCCLRDPSEKETQLEKQEKTGPHFFSPLIQPPQGSFVLHTCNLLSALYKAIHTAQHFAGLIGLILATLTVTLHFADRKMGAQGGQGFAQGNLGFG